MLKKKSGLITRRSLLKSSAATGAALVSGVGGVSLFNVTGALAAMANPADVLAGINVGKIREEGISRAVQAWRQ